MTAGLEWRDEGAGPLQSQAHSQTGRSYKGAPRSGGYPGVLACFLGTYFQLDAKTVDETSLRLLGKLQKIFSKIDFSKRHLG